MTAQHTRIPAKLSSLGPIIQLAYVPKDFDAALRYWTESLGVGPFFLASHYPIDRIYYEGTQTNLDFSVAVSCWGDIQIELIRQHNSAPSIFRDWDSDTLHHIQIGSLDYRPALDACRDLGLELVMEGRGAPGIPEFKFAFCQLGPGAPAGYVEMLDLPSPSIREQMMARLKHHSLSWNGENPLRNIGEI